MNKNISPDWQGSTQAERKIIKRLISLEKTPGAIKYFAKKCDLLSDYWYWFMLGLLWVSYNGYSDLYLWKKLFKSKRPNQKTSLMKPDEFEFFQVLPEEFKAFRAHREGEKDWISYTLSPEKAGKFACQRGVKKVSMHMVKKSDILAYFNRRGEFEILILDKSRVEFVRNIHVEIR